MLGKLLLPLVFLAGCFVTVIILKQRADWLASLEFEIVQPDVPYEILQLIQSAESNSYAERSAIRRRTEELQDVLVFAWPEAAYRANFSVGRYRIKARTIEDILPWAEEQKYLVLQGSSLKDFAHALAYFAEQPALNDWQASLYLEWLRQSHPQLAKINWSQISENPSLIAKLYSGYMGAGGAWDLWRADLVPGPVALDRMGLSSDQSK